MTAMNPNHHAAGRIKADERLDNLYMSEMRCPYCQTKMPKGTSKCKNCALTKEQIYYADLTIPYGKSNVLMSHVRPAGVSYGKMVAGSVFGFLGLHCFFAKRPVRGAIMLFLTLLYFVTVFIFPPVMGEADAHPARAMFDDKGLLFPCDLIAIFVLGMWIWDMFAVIFGQFKYPVVPKIEEEA